MGDPSTRFCLICLEFWPLHSPGKSSVHTRYVLDCNNTGVTGGTFHVMRARAYRIGSQAPLAVAMALCGLSPAFAGEASYCVTCQGPDQTYLCRVTGDEISQSDAVKLYCVVRTAKEGGHASCGARNAGASRIDREVVVDDLLVTSRWPDDIPAFGRQLIEVFSRWRRETPAGRR